MDRVILHCDLNNFYATVECKKHPELANFPVAVCGSIQDRHGIILAKNELAKSFGVSTGQVVWQARIQCPQLVLLPPHFAEYCHWSRQAREIYGCFTDQVEPFGIDECWLDVTGSTRLFGQGEEIAHQIRRRIKEELGLTISVGVSFNKVFAKLGSDLKKPDAVSIISKERYPEIVWPLKTSALLGVGGATSRQLARVGILTIGQLAQTDPGLLRKLLGKNGEILWRNANGYDMAPVLRQHEIPPVKSVGNSTTCVRDLTTSQEVWRVFLQLAEKVSSRLRQEHLVGGNLTVSVKDKRLVTQEHGCKLEVPTRNVPALAQTAIKLFEEFYDWKWPVRALGIRAGELVTDLDANQLSLFWNSARAEREEWLEGQVDDLRSRFGRGIIRRASLMEPTGAGGHSDEPTAFHRGWI